VRRRREFITPLGGAAVWPVAARAQQGERMRRIGVLAGSAAARRYRRADAMRTSMTEMGRRPRAASALAGFLFGD
jgi:putative ABC transport system substrate-binding protein